MRRYIKILTGAAVAALALAGCSGSSRNELPADTLVTVGTRSLTLSEIRREMPGGMTAEDSATFVRASVRRWIERNLVRDVAARNVDMDQVDRLVQEYRDELIMTLYRREMARQADNTFFPDDTLRAYYDAHTSDFILERPLVKGVYLKVEENARDLPRLKRVYRSERAIDIDDLEKIAPTAATHYDYFRDRWVDWEQIETRIPADIPSVDAFLHGNRTLEVDAGGFTYLLHITEFLPTGAPKPFEAARPEIRERLLNMERRRYDTQLRNDLYTRSVEDGTVTFPNGDPFAAH